MSDEPSTAHFGVAAFILAKTALAAVEHLGLERRVLAEALEAALRKLDGLQAFKDIDEGVIEATRALLEAEVENARRDPNR